MKHTLAPWIMRFFFPVMILFILSGCDNSGYGAADPYVITGTVSNGGEPVNGKVYARTNKRYDLYEAIIDSGSGSYTLTVSLPDPPYILWAEIDGSRDLYSFTPGSRNTGIVGSVKEQTVNINPMTDMIMSLAYNEDTNERFSRETSKLLPKSSEINYHQTELEKLFEDAFISICLKDGFNLFHGDFSGDVATLLGSLATTFINTEDERTVSLVGGIETYYEYDLENKEKTSNVTSEDAELLLFIQTGLARPTCK